MIKKIQINLCASCTFFDSIAILMVLIGMFGIILFLRNPNAYGQTQPLAQLETLQVFSVKSDKMAFNNSFKNYEMEYILSALDLKTNRSILEVGQVLHASVSHYQPELPLYISFGDGTFQMLRKNVVNHIYKKTGKFYVKLYFKETGKLRIIHNKMVTITHQIEIEEII